MKLLHRSDSEDILLLGPIISIKMIAKMWIVACGLSYASAWVEKIMLALQRPKKCQRYILSLEILYCVHVCVIQSH